MRLKIINCSILWKLVTRTHLSNTFNVLTVAIDVCWFARRWSDITMSSDSQAISRLCLLGSITLVPNSLYNRALRKMSLTDDILHQHLAFSLTHKLIRIP